MPTPPGALAGELLQGGRGQIGQREQLLRHAGCPESGDSFTREAWRTDHQSRLRGACGKRLGRFGNGGGVGAGLRFHDFYPADAGGCRLGSGQT